MKTYYQSIITNKFLTSLGWLTNEQLDFYDHQEELWRSQCKELSLLELVKVFPQGKQFVVRDLKQAIKENKRQVISLTEQRTQTIVKKNQMPADQHWIYEQIAENIRIRADALNKKIKKDTFLLSAITRTSEPVSKTDRIDETDIARAKEFPLTSLLEVNRAGFAICPFHKDDHPSLKVYKNNRYWCYGACASGGDSIQFVQKRDNCDFITAVKTLIGK